MGHHLTQLDSLHDLADHHLFAGTTLAYGIAFLYLVHQALVYFDYPILSPHELIWNAIVYVLPRQALLDRARRQELQANGMLSQTHAAKSEALRKMLGLGGNTILQKLPGESVVRRASVFARRESGSDRPAGLGNWDNSCYQNSVLQGLASLECLRQYLSRRAGLENSTTESLLETVNKLNNEAHNGRQLWTPAKLKNMSSWQQQDAQEYFSKIVDELDKDAAKMTPKPRAKRGLETVVELYEDLEMSKGECDGLGGTSAPTDTEFESLRNPMEGLLAQRVACTRCGFSEGLSMIPFNCLTVPLGSESAYSLEECLDEYSKLEEITDVECAKCTLLRAEEQLVQMLPPPPSFQANDAVPGIDSKMLALPPELRAQAFQRLRTIHQALEQDDFSDKTLNDICHIPKKARVSSTKTRQAVVGRAPQALVIHVNRSVFDEMTGAQMKNYASVRYPMALDLGAWMLSVQRPDDKEAVKGPTESMLTAVRSTTHQLYRLRAVVTHYGRHENGHYICYRKHPAHSKSASDFDGSGEPEDDDPSQVNNETRWWRLSDEDVSPVSEADVLRQGGVFMLFYEREQNAGDAMSLERDSVAASEPECQLLDSHPRREKHQERIIQQEQVIDIDPKATVEHPVLPTPSTDPEDISEPSTPFSDPDTYPSTEATTEDESEAEPVRTSKVPAQPLMRTARGNQASGSEMGLPGIGFRAMAAT